MSSRIQHSGSILTETRDRLDAYPQMLDATSVASLSPFDRLETLASRSALDCLTHCAGIPWLFGAQNIHKGNLTLIVTSASGTVASLSSVGETICSAGARTIANRLAWLFDVEAISPEGPIGRFLGEFDNILAMCEHALPHQRRLKFILESDEAWEGRQTFPEPMENHYLELQSAEDWVFRSSVFTTVISELLLDEESHGAMLWGLSSPFYISSSRHDKARHVGKMLHPRLTVLRWNMQRDGAVQEEFLMHVLAVWLHMISFNGKLGENTLSGPPGTKYFESPYDVDNQDADPGCFPQPMVDMLPGVLAFFREHAES